MGTGAPLPPEVFVVVDGVKSPVAVHFRAVFGTLDFRFSVSEGLDKVNLILDPHKPPEVEDGTSVSGRQTHLTSWAQSAHISWRSRSVCFRRLYSLQSAAHQHLNSTWGSFSVAATVKLALSLFILATQIKHLDLDGVHWAWLTWFLSRVPRWQKSRPLQRHVRDNSSGPENSPKETLQNYFC